MRRTLVTGGALAVFAALLAQFGGGLGLEQIRSALLGAALGAALGIVPALATAVQRVLGFLLGFVLGWGGYAVRAAVLPDSAAGRALSAFLVIGILTVVCAVSVGWAPLWAGLLGVAAIAGAYEYTFNADPTAFTTQSLTAATTVLLAVAVGFLVGAVAEVFGERAGERVIELPEPREPVAAGSGRHRGQGEQGTDEGIGLVVDGGEGSGAQAAGSPRTGSDREQD